MKMNHKENCQCGVCKTIRGETKGIKNSNYKHGQYIHNYCIDCNKEITPNNKTKRCCSCAHKGKLNYLFKTNKKRVSAFKGKQHTKKSKQKLRKKALERFKDKKNHPSFGKKRPDMAGENNLRFGKRIKPNWGKYKEINMRSSWEIQYAQFLDLSGHKWLYESKVFNLGKSTYTPDFYIPEWDLYVEIKGYFSDYAKKKFKLFRKQYPEVKIKVLTKPKLENMGVLE